ncbi:Kelch repeat-containing protein [Sorangium cellulosum]|uniref:Kelch repeat-containing protein n=1 Tax=Sorangium cellulosum TaxID=56 RepID=UPI003D9A162C
MMRTMWRLGGGLSLGLAALTPGVVWAASSPSWESVPSMSTPRGEHTATVLQDGRVLVAGGFPVVDAPPFTNLVAISLREVEIYDPATRTWSPAAPLAQPRSGHAAILLPSGRVLVAGGRSRSEMPAGAALSSVELYDPASNTWTAAAPLPMPHPSPSMMLVDGRPVLVGSGLNNLRDSDQFNSAIYDPESGGWTELPHCIGVERIEFLASGILPVPVSATLLHDGRLMAVGNGCSLYDLQSQLWTWEHGAVMDTSEYRYPHVTALPGGDVLVVGGTLTGPDPEVHAFAQVYLPRDDRWEPTSGPYAPASTPCGWSTLGIRGGAHLAAPERQGAADRGNGALQGGGIERQHRPLLRDEGALRRGDPRLVAPRAGATGHHGARVPFLDAAQGRQRADRRRVRRCDDRDGVCRALP